ncbi:MAG: TIGR04219 family outer membrane beta-barrel protein [Gammaproteobacteria bacterium]|nr:MAG: TIGR04219 family outer membrane beta-barrel protein [Gammaproteobacteria bacterium]
MKIKQLLCLAALSIPFTVHADTLSVSAGAGIWNTSPTGSFQKIGDSTAVDVKDNLFWGDETQGYLFATLEHPVPIIPNVRLVITKIDQSGSGNTSFIFDGVPYTGNVNNDFSIQTNDLIAYYEILDNVVSLDIGLTIRNLKVDYTITSATITTTDSMNETFPMLYALVGGSPIPDLIISGELSYIAYSGSTISDFTAKVAYTTNFFVGFEAGYRKQTYKFDDVSGTDANLDFDGVFAGAYIKF